MRGLVAVSAGLLCFAAAQVPPRPAAPQDQATEKSAEPSPQPVLLHNTGKPIIVEYHCSEDDIQSTGMSCTPEDPCPVYLELSAVEAVGNRIFLAGNIHSSAATLYSVLLASDDAGKTWREPHERIRAAGLDRIQFVDFENGWVGGEVLHPLPRDPFLLVTSDGGKVWKSQAIFAEPRFGSILQFWFSSRSNGSMLIDRGESGESGRYELYETPNAGDTWMLREVSDKMIRIKNAAGTADADWRIRADAASKSFRIEHHTSERWQSLAGFSVLLGACKPPQPVPAPESNEPGTGTEPTAPQKSRPPGQ